MIQQLFNVLEEQMTLTSRIKRLLMDNISTRRYDDREHFVKEGEHSNVAGFVISGVFRYYMNSDNQNEITSLFIQQNQFVVKMESFYNGQPSTRSIQALGQCEVLEITKESYDLVAKESQEFQIVMGKAGAKFLDEVASFQRRIIDIEAEDKYKEFLKEYPKLLKRVSLGQIASFLGMTQSTLSRVRKKMLN